MIRHEIIETNAYTQMRQHWLAMSSQEEEEEGFLEYKPLSGLCTRTLFSSVRSTHSLFYYQTLYQNPLSDPSALCIGLMDSRLGTNRHEIIVLDINQENRVYYDVSALIFAATIGAKEAARKLLSALWFKVNITPRDNISHREISFLKDSLLAAVSIANQYHHSSIAEIIHSSLIWARV